MFSLQQYTTLHGLVTGLGIHSSLFTKRVKREIHSFNSGNDSFALKKQSIRTKNQRANSQPWILQYITVHNAVAVCSQGFSLLG